MILEFKNVHHGWTNLLFSFSDYMIKINFSAVCDTFPDFLNWVNKVDDLNIKKTCWVNIDQEGYNKKLIVNNIDGELIRLKVTTEKFFSFQIILNKEYFVCQLAKVLNNYIVDYPNEHWAGGNLDEIIEKNCSQFINKYKNKCKYKTDCLKSCERFKTSPTTGST